MRVAACKNALPFDVAFTADDYFVTAWAVTAGEIEGAEFDWDRFRWVEKKK